MRKWILSQSDLAVLQLMRILLGSSRLMIVNKENNQEMENQNFAEEIADQSIENRDFLEDDHGKGSTN